MNPIGMKNGEEYTISLQLNMNIFSRFSYTEFKNIIFITDKIFWCIRSIF